MSRPSAFNARLMALAAATISPGLSEDSNRNNFASLAPRICVARLFGLHSPRQRSAIPILEEREGIEPSRPLASKTQPRKPARPGYRKAAHDRAAFLYLDRLRIA